MDAQNERSSDSTQSGDLRNSAIDGTEQATFVDWGSSESLTGSGYITNENDGK